MKDTPQGTTSKEAIFAKEITWNEDGETFTLDGTSKHTMTGAEVLAYEEDRKKRGGGV